MTEVEVNRFNSENAQHFLISDLPKRISILDNEKYLFLPTEWTSDNDFIVLKFRAEQMGYKIEYANTAPKSSIKLIFDEIERAIEAVTNLTATDYCIREKTNNLHNVRSIYIYIAKKYKIEYSTIAAKLNRTIDAIKKTEKKHDDMFRFNIEYRRLYNDVMTIIKNNQVIERV